MARNVAILNVSRVYADFKKFSLNLQTRTDIILNDFAYKIKKDAEMRASQGATGKLKKSIKIKARISKKRSERLIYANADYGLYVEQGTDPHNVSVKALSERGALYKWVKKKWGGTKKEVKRKTFGLGRHIQQRGTKKHPFLSLAFDKYVRDFQSQIRNVIKGG